VRLPLLKESVAKLGNELQASEEIPLLAVMQGGEFARLQLVSEFCNTLQREGTDSLATYLDRNR
jgi:hypothetical protein